MLFNTTVFCKKIFFEIITENVLFLDMCFEKIYIKSQKICVLKHISSKTHIFQNSITIKNRGFKPLFSSYLFHNHSDNFFLAAFKDNTLVGQIVLRNNHFFIGDFVTVNHGTVLLYESACFAF